MNLDTAVEIFTERLDEEHISLNIDEFRLTDIVIKKLSDADYNCRIETYNYHTPGCGESNRVVLFYVEDCDPIDLLHDVYEIFNTDGKLKYSRITDNVYTSDEELKKEEDYKLAEYFFMRKVVENCSVCMEPNTVKTSCNHNLCRYCAKLLGNKFRCPVCRGKLSKCACAGGGEFDADMEEDEDL